MWVATASLSGQIIHAELPGAEVNFTLMPAQMPANTYKYIQTHVATPTARSPLAWGETGGFNARISSFTKTAQRECGRDIAFI